MTQRLRNMLCVFAVSALMWTAIIIAATHI